jgi:hypothetical protein
MSDRPDDTLNLRLPNSATEYPPLPWWLARRRLRPDEKVTWVCGPQRQPSWERFITHPLLLLFGLGLAGLTVVLGWLIAGRGTVPMVPGLLGLVILFGSVIFLALANAHFTRLVVTDARLLILQGYEVVRAWKIDDLPRSLIRYGMRGRGEESRAIDLDALKTMLGGASDKFAESKTILKFGKHLDRIRSSGDDLTDRL